MSATNTLPATQAVVLTGTGLPWRLPLLLAVLFVVIPSLAGEYWLGVILVPWLVLSLAGLGLNLLTGYAGQISLGSGGLMAVGAFGTFLLMLHVPGLPLPAALLPAGLITAAVGFICGIPSDRIKGFYLMVSSLAAQFFLEWLFLRFPWFYNYGGGATISLPSLTILGIDFGSARGRYYLVLTIVVALTWIAANLLRGHVGRNWTAIRDMDTAAAVVGIPVNRYKRLAFAVSAFYLGIAGALWAFAYLGSASVQSFNITRSFQILFIIIIGGMGSLGGSFIGAAFISLLPLGLDTLSQSLFAGHVDAGLLQNIEKVIFGVLIAVFVIKEPDGIARLAALFRARAAIWPLRL